MTRPGRRMIVPALLLCWAGAAAAREQAPAPLEPPQMVETVFKDIQVLKGIPVDQFMDTMGMFAAALAKDCTGCHSSEILDGGQAAFAIQTPMIQRARQMVVMVNTINKQFFGAQKRVTCATCHINAAAPENIPNLGLQYGTPLENPSSMSFFTAPGVKPDQVQYYVDLFKKVMATPEWNKLMEEGAFNRTALVGKSYAEWVAKEEQRHRELMKAAGFLAGQ